MILRRRDQSGNKPFCDGAHPIIGLDGTPAN
jgi:CDGSH-type Zn-finger protein